MINYLSLALLLGISYGRSGNPGSKVRCFTDQHHDHSLHNHPSLVDEFNAIERHWRQNPKYINKFVLNNVRNINPDAACQNDSCSFKDVHDIRSAHLPNPLTIPINFHIVKSPQTQHIGYQQIISQIRSLNKDFMKENNDLTADTHYSSLAGDFNMNFVLNKIIRINTSVTSFDPRENFIKYSSMGGSDSTDNMYALNFWVAELGGILGYATFPGDFRDLDGVVIDSQSFGSTNYADSNDNWDVRSPYNLGRTATHEIGHWLNLKHIWGEPQYRWQNGCNYDDSVSDTPVDDGPNYGCPADNDMDHVHPTSCGTHDMYMNFMDYVNDGCMNMFTKGQIDRAEDIFLPDAYREYFTDYAKNPSLTKFVNYFYFINKNQKCDNGHIKRELSLKNKDLCVSYSNNPHIDVITNIHVLHKDTECPELYQKIDTILDNESFVCYKKGPQKLFKDKMITDLDVFELNNDFNSSTYNGYILNPSTLCAFNNGTNMHVLGAKTVQNNIIINNNMWCSVFGCNRI